MLQETCHQVAMVSEMMGHPEDSTEDPQEAEASGTEAASEIEVASEEETGTKIVVLAFCANSRAILQGIALSRETVATVREVATSQENQEVNKHMTDEKNSLNLF